MPLISFFLVKQPWAKKGSWAKVANLSTEGEACRNKADGVSNGRWRRALAKGLTWKHGVRGQHRFTQGFGVSFCFFFSLQKVWQTRSRSKPKGTQKLWAAGGFCPTEMNGYEAKRSEKEWSGAKNTGSCLNVGCGELQEVWQPFYPKGKVVGAKTKKYY